MFLSSLGSLCLNSFSLVVNCFGIFPTDNFCDVVGELILLKKNHC